MKWKSLVAALLLSVPAGLPAAEPFFFIQIADPQFGMFTDNQDFAQETANLDFAVSTINRLHPAFVVVSGDLVNKPGDGAQIHEYQRIMRRVASDIPVYPVVGNHDIGNAPSPADITAYTNSFGPDHYTFRHQDFLGIVLNSVLIHTPDQATNQFAEQEVWLQGELQRARANGAQHVVIFGHHPWFLKAADEADEYFNIPSQRRARYLGWFREAGVKQLFSGHYHRNAVAHDGDLEAITTGPVGKPLGEDSSSGLRVVIVREDGITHRFYHFGELPNRIDLASAPPAAANR